MDTKPARIQFAKDHPNDPRHGTLNFYNNYGCRCDLCRKANAGKRQHGTGVTGRQNGVRTDTIAVTLMHHHLSNIHGQCICGFHTGENREGMEHHRARMISNAMFGTHYKDGPDHQPHIHEGSLAEVRLHQQYREALCNSCLDWLDECETPVVYGYATSIC